MLRSHSDYETSEMNLRTHTNRLTNHLTGAEPDVLYYKVMNNNIREKSTAVRRWCRDWGHFISVITSYIKYISRYIDFFYIFHWATLVPWQQEDPKFNLTNWGLSVWSLHVLWLPPTVPRVYPQTAGIGSSPPYLRNLAGCVDCWLVDFVDALYLYCSLTLCYQVEEVKDEDVEVLQAAAVAGGSQTFL